jgi:hypothetical protein
LRAPLPPFAGVFPDILNRDTEYEFARNHPTLTWEKVWWRMSGGLYGLFLRALCDAWLCTIEDLLTPLEQRHWSDSLALDNEALDPVWGYLLQCPDNPS